MKPKEHVFMTQEFDGQQMQNIYHIKINPELYLKLDKLRRQLNLGTITEVVHYLLHS